LSMAISAILSPFLGAVADTSGSKKRFLMTFCYGAILVTGLLRCPRRKHSVPLPAGQRGLPWNVFKCLSS
jgi:MFS-type transporter involved in bile tolerance (Atg22 family)